MFVRVEIMTTKLVIVSVLFLVLLLGTTSSSAYQLPNSSQLHSQSSSPISSSNPGIASVHVTFSAKDSVFLTKSSGSRLVVTLWRYAPSTGATTLVGQKVTPLASSDLSFSDPQVSMMSQISPYVHYSISAYELTASGQMLNFVNYHWDHIAGASTLKVITLDPAVNSSYTAAHQTSDVVPNISHSNSSSPTSDSLSSPTQVSSSSPASGPNYPCSPCSGWVTIKTWYGQFSIVGEAHAAGYLTLQYVFGTSSGSEFDVMVGTSGWSASGSKTQDSTTSQTWPNLSCCQGWLAETQFDYVEQEFFSYGSPTGQYQSFVTNYDGGLPTCGGPNAWICAGNPYADPASDCASPPAITNGQEGSYFTEPANSPPVVKEQSNGFKYSFSVNLPSPVGDTATLNLGDTTSYNQHVTQTITTGGQYSTYYFYGGPGGGFPVIFSSNSAGHCGP